MTRFISINFGSLIIRQFLMLSACVVLLAGCDNDDQISKAKIEADKLLNDISFGKANNSFPEKYFPANQTQPLMEELKEKCDFANRKGTFINEYLHESFNGRRISFIYEYYLECDSIRFVVTYKLGKEIELFEFILEPIEKNNPMITKPERRLKF
jgi:hypothetical protein